MRNFWRVGFSALILFFLVCTEISKVFAETTSVGKYALADIDVALKLGKLGSSELTIDQFIAMLQEQGQQSQATGIEGARQTPTGVGDNPSGALTLIDYFPNEAKVTLYATNQGYHTLYALCTGHDCGNTALRMANQSGHSESASFSSGLIHNTLSVAGLTTLQVTDSAGNRITTAPNNFAGVCITHGTPLANIAPTQTTFTVLDYLIDTLLNRNPAFLALLDPQHYLSMVYSLGASAISPGINNQSILKSAFNGVVVCSLSTLIEGNLTEYVVLLQTASTTTTAIQALVPRGPSTISTGFAFPAAGQIGLAPTVATAFPYQVSPHLRGILAGLSQSDLQLKLIQSLTESNPTTGACLQEPNRTAVQSMARVDIHLTSQQPQVGSYQASSAQVNNISIGNESAPFVLGCRSVTLEGTVNLNKNLLTANSQLWMAFTYLPGGAYLNNIFRIPAVGNVASGLASIFLGVFSRGTLSTTESDPVDATPFFQRLVYELEDL